MKFHEDGFCEEDLIVFTKERWNHMFPRTQHLMTRFARYRRVFIFEKPRFDQRETSWLRISEGRGGVVVVVPHLPLFVNHFDQMRILADLIDELREREQIFQHVCWYDSSFGFVPARHLDPLLTIYDAGEEVGRDEEQDLLERADFISVATHSHWERKKGSRKNVQHLPSGVDSLHFGRARSSQIKDPCDQKPIAGPRLGFFGSLDERLDVKLLDQIARMRPYWNFVFIGPITGIDSRQLPPWSNIKYLGAKDYDQLPSYLAGWSAAIVPFALNEKSISSSSAKIKEYLAGGCPVISTGLPEAAEIHHLIRIAQNAEEFVKACEETLKSPRDSAWLEQVDRFLRGKSWDDVWLKIACSEAQLLKRRPQANVARRGALQRPSLLSDISTFDVSPSVSFLL